MGVRNIETRAHLYAALRENAPFLFNSNSSSEVRAAINRYLVRHGIEVLIGPRNEEKTEYVRYDNFDVLIRASRFKPLSDSDRAAGYFIRTYPYHDEWPSFVISSGLRIACPLCSRFIAMYVADTRSVRKGREHICGDCFDRFSTMKQEVEDLIQAAEKVLSDIAAVVKENKNAGCVQQCSDDAGSAAYLARRPRLAAEGRDQELGRACARLFGEAGDRHTQGRGRRYADADRQLRTDGIAEGGLASHALIDASAAQ